MHIPQVFSVERNQLVEPVLLRLHRFSDFGVCTGYRHNVWNIVDRSPPEKPMPLFAWIIILNYVEDYLSYSVGPTSCPPCQRTAYFALRSNLSQQWIGWCPRYGFSQTMTSHRAGMLGGSKGDMGGTISFECCVECCLLPRDVAETPPRRPISFLEL